jgi:hypothetical protein
MSEEESKINEGLQKKWKAPLDVKIVAWFFIIVGIIGILLDVLLIIGIAKSASGSPRKVFFGAFNLISGTSNGMYFLMIGTMNFITGYILKKGSKIGWWLAFAGSINGISDSILLGFLEYKNSATTGIFINLSIIIWLLYRRKIYNIGSRTEIKV